MFEKRKDNPADAMPLGMQSANPKADVNTNNRSRSTAVIGQSIKIKGTIVGDENLIIEGTVEGSVQLQKHDLIIGESGQVTADLNANTVKVDGFVAGDITGTEKVIITKSGRVEGNITAPRVTLEDGAKFKGSIDMDPGEQPAQKPTVVKTPATAGSEKSEDVKATRSAHTPST